MPTPPATETHRPIPCYEIVQALIETLGFRHLGVVHGEYAVSPDGMKAFGVLDLATEMEGCRPQSELTDVTARVIIYEAFIEGKLEAPKHLARTIHDLYFEPQYEEFRSRTIWSLSNALTSAFKELAPISQFKADARLVSS